MAGIFSLSSPGGEGRGEEASNICLTNSMAAPRKRVIFYTNEDWLLGNIWEKTSPSLFLGKMVGAVRFELTTF